MSSKQSNLLPILVVSAAATCVALYFLAASSKPPSSDDEEGKKRSSDTPTGKENWGWHVTTEPPTPDQGNWHVKKNGEKSKDASLQLPADVVPPKDEKTSAEAPVKARPLSKRASSSSLSDKGAEASVEEKNPAEEEPAKEEAPAAQEPVVETQTTPVPSDEKPEEQPVNNLEESAVLVEKEPEPEKVEEPPETDHPSPTPPSPASDEKTQTENETPSPPAAASEETTPIPEEQPPAPEETKVEETKPEDEVPVVETNNIGTAAEPAANLVSPTNSVPPELPTPQNDNSEAKKESDLWDYLQEEIQKVTTKCEGCGKEETDVKFKPCAKCRTVVYCGRACQKKHWKAHKKFCCK